jgi:hypothetical protein
MKYARPSRAAQRCWKMASSWAGVGASESRVQVFNHLSSFALTERVFNYWDDFQKDTTERGKGTDKQRSCALGV